MANTTSKKVTSKKTTSGKVTSKKVTSKKAANVDTHVVAQSASVVNQSEITTQFTTWLLITSNRKAGTISGMIAHTNDIDSVIKRSRQLGEHFVCVGTDTKFRAYIDNGLEKGMRGVIAALTKKGVTDVASFLKDALDKAGEDRIVLIQKPVEEVTIQ